MSSIIRRDPYMTDRGFQSSRAVVKCECGEEVLCASFTNTCDCGADYNMSGQLLAPREQWGEETGEHYADVALITGREDW